MRFVPQLPIDGVGDAPAAERTREHVRHSGKHRLRRQIRAPRVHHREHERRGTLRPQLARELQRGRAARQIDEHRHLATLQLVQRRHHRIGPDDRYAGG